MTLNIREYHRTFNILRLSGRMPSGAELAHNLDRELKEARAKYRGLPDHQALDLLRADKLRKPLPVHDAFEDTGSEYRTARIEEKRDQDFQKVATPWELKWSRLVHWDLRLTPVVDNSGAVVAYTGNIDYQNLLIDQTFHPLPFAPGMEHVETLKHYRVFVGTNEFYGRTDLKVFGDSGIARHTVLTDIYGEVMWFERGGRRDDSITSISWLEIAGSLTLARSVLRIGLGLATSLGRTGLRTLTRRPPAPIPAMGPMNTMTGMAVATPTKIPLAFQGRKALVLGDDMATLTPHVNQIPSQPGLFDVIVHGDKTGFYILKNNAWQKVSVSDLAHAIRTKLGPNDKIRLIGCETGVLGGPAQQLGSELGRNVFAPTTAVYAKLGTFFKASHPKFNTINGAKVYESVKGHLTEVTPDKFGKYVTSKGGELVKFVPGKSIVPVDGGTFTEIIAHRGSAEWGR